MFKIVPYTDEVDISKWNNFVTSSRNATFILLRGYMDYHAHRFKDASLLIYDEKNRLKALFAASASGDTITAHGGLTYGGIVLPPTGVNCADTLDIFNAIAAHYRSQGFKTIVYKAIPYIYHRQPSDDDIYAIFRLGGGLREVNASTTIDLESPYTSAADSNSLRGAKKATTAGITVQQEAPVTQDSYPWKRFWQILTNLLHERYNTSPVHSLEEISLLASRFPQEIRLFTCRNATNEIVAGAVLYFTHTTAHVQYIAADPEGKTCLALHLLFTQLTRELKGKVRYLDFGTSNEAHGTVLNRGLITQKHGYGGRTVAYTTYELSL